MNLQAYLEELRARPEHERRKIALWWSAGLTAVIFLFWISSMTITQISARQAVSAAIQKTSSPAQSLVAGVGAFTGDVWNMIVGPKKITYSTVEVLPGSR
ncbi:MAG: hypothetical protein ABSF56_02340 [Minisyncoccia bacterium]|jgi:hypothetical protein